LLLSMSSTILGVLCAYGLMHTLVGLIPVDTLDAMPFLRGIGINLHILLFALAVTFVSSVLFAIAPLLRLPLDDVRDGLSQGGRSAAGTVWRHFGSNLVAVELCTAMVLLSGAGLLGRSFYRIMHADTGIQTDHLAVLRIGPSNHDAYEKPNQQIALSQEM